MFSAGSSEACYAMAWLVSMLITNAFIVFFELSHETWSEYRHDEGCLKEKMWQILTASKRWSEKENENGRALIFQHQFALKGLVTHERNEIQGKLKTVNGTVNSHYSQRESES